MELQLRLQGPFSQTVPELKVLIYHKTMLPLHNENDQNLVTILHISRQINCCFRYRFTYINCITKYLYNTEFWNVVFIKDTARFWSVHSAENRWLLKQYISVIGIRWCMIQKNINAIQCVFQHYEKWNMIQRLLMQSHCICLYGYRIWAIVMFCSNLSASPFQLLWNLQLHNSYAANPHTHGWLSSWLQ